MLRQQNGFRGGRETEDGKIMVFVILCFSAASVVVTKKMFAVAVAVL
jgi:hypothetical protein